MQRSLLIKGINLAVLSLFISSSAGAAEMARDATITQTEGQVMARIGQGDWMPAERGMVLHEGDEIKTGPKSQVELLLDEGKVGKVEIKENSAFKLDILQKDPSNGDKVTLLDLAMGKVLVHAEKLSGDSKFEVKTPTSTTGVRGTVFEVEVEPAE